MDKLRLKFSKTGRAVYSSHLDLMRTMQRSFARAGLPLKYSEGFNPHAKLSILLPLTVGTASLCEYMDFSLAAETDLDRLPGQLNPFLPEGIEALEAYEAPGKGAELRWLRLRGRMTGGRDAAFYRAFFARPEILVKKRGKRGERIDNIAPAIGTAEFTDGGPGRVLAELLLHAQEPTLNPDTMMTALGEDAPAYYIFTRIEALREDRTPFR